MTAADRRQILGRVYDLSLPAYRETLEQIEQGERWALCAGCGRYESISSVVNGAAYCDRCDEARWGYGA